MGWIGVNPDVGLAGLHLCDGGRHGRNVMEIEKLSFASERNEVLKWMRRGESEVRSQLRLHDSSTAWWSNSDPPKP